MPLRLNTPRLIISGLAAGAAVAIGIAASTAPAHADAGLGPQFTLKFAKNARLLPTLHATEVLDAAEIQDGREYDYVVKGYFKIAGKTVARLPAFTGHVDATRQHITLAVNSATRHTIRAAAKRHGAHRVTLTLAYRLTQTNKRPGDPASVLPYADDAYLTIPRN